MAHLFRFLAVTSVLVPSIIAIDCYYGSYIVKDGVVTEGNLSGNSCPGNYCIWQTVVTPTYTKKSFNCDVVNKCESGGYDDKEVNGDTAQTSCCKGDYCNAIKTNAVGSLATFVITCATVLYSTFA